MYGTGLDLPSCLFMSALVVRRIYSFQSRTLMSQKLPQSRAGKNVIPMLWSVCGDFTDYLLLSGAPRHLSGQDLDDAEPPFQRSH